MPSIVPPVINLKVILPELVMVITALVILLLDLVLAKGKKTPLAVLSLLGLAVSLILSIGMWKGGVSTYAFNHMIVVDRFTLLSQ